MDVQSPGREIAALRTEDSQAIRRTGEHRAVDGPQRRIPRGEDAHQPGGDPGDVVVGIAGPDDQVERLGRLRQRESGVHRRAGGEPRQQVRQRPFRPPLGVGPRLVDPRALQRLAVRRDRGIRVAQRGRPLDQAPRVAEIAQSPLRDGEHVQCVVRLGRDRQHLAIEARSSGLVVRGLSREGGVHELGQMRTFGRIDAVPIGPLRPIGRRGRRSRRRLRTGSVDRAVALAVAASAAARTRRVARHRRAGHGAHRRDSFAGKRASATSWNACRSSRSASVPQRTSRVGVRTHVAPRSTERSPGAGCGSASIATTS